MVKTQGCSVDGCCVSLLAVVNFCLEGAVFAAMGVLFFALLDVEIIPEIDRANKNVRGTL